MGLSSHEYQSLDSDIKKKQLIDWADDEKLLVFMKSTWNNEHSIEYAGVNMI